MPGRHQCLGSECCRLSARLARRDASPNYPGVWIVHRRLEQHLHAIARGAGDQFVLQSAASLILYDLCKRMDPCQSESFHRFGTFLLGSLPEGIKSGRYSESTKGFSGISSSTEEGLTRSSSLYSR